ncbi:MAG: hypothetical protein HDS79_01525 [Bacteroidales bacterium]|nr:hypothetical protein [Bacteroidales bacterium]
MIYQHGDFLRPMIPNGKRRDKNHDYHKRCIYLITINAAPGMPPFSRLKGIPGNRQYPPSVELTDVGEHIARELYNLKNHFPVSILRKVIMPEHIHFVIFVKEYMEWHLGDVIRWFKTAVTMAVAGCCEWNDRSEEERAKRSASVFEEGYNDRILRGKGQKQRMLNYVSDNPRRRLLKMMNPGFHQHQIVRLTMDSEEMGHEYRLQGGMEFSAYGNIDLLMEPDLEAVKIGRALINDPKEMIKRKKIWLQTIETGGVIASPFIKDDEKRVRDWALANGGRLIVIRWDSFGERYKPGGMWFDPCSEGRVLEISFGGTRKEAENLSRRQCMLMNELAAAIAAGKVIDPRGR